MINCILVGTISITPKDKKLIKNPKVMEWYEQVEKELFKELCTKCFLKDACKKYHEQ